MFVNQDQKKTVQLVLTVVVLILQLLLGLVDLSMKDHLENVQDGVDSINSKNLSQCLP